MKINQIIVAPFAFETIIDYESVIRLNEHGYAKITGFVTEEQRDKALELMTNDVWVQVCFLDEDGTEKLLFCGLAVNMKIQSNEGFYMMTLELKTGTFLMDIKEHIRVFQSGSTTYSKMQNALLSTYTTGECLMVKPDSPAGEMLVQYKETDWEFAKRLASRRKTVLVPNEKSIGVKYSFGLAESAGARLDSYDCYQIIKGIGTYQIKKQNGLSDLEENDEMAYGVDSREVFFLGDSVVFMGHNYLIAEIQRKWINKEVCNHYVLKKLKGTQQCEYRNKKIIGATLSGFVSGVERDKVRITVDCDEYGNQGGSRLFDYSTVFSSPDGTGWYCMPEEGDSIQLHFPSEVEKMAYVSSSVNLQSEDPNARKDPLQKSIKNKDQKEILFTPDRLVITNNQGMSIIIDDSFGILMVSDKDIKLQAQANISLISEQQNIQLSAAQQLLLQQNATCLEMAENITMHGGQVNIQ